MTGRPVPPHLARPRSIRAHDAVLAATKALLEQGGLAAATVDAISERSGVSKATIYKHWPSRTAVAAEAFGLQMEDRIGVPDTGSTVGDLAEHIRRVSEFYASPAGPVVAQLLAASMADVGCAEYFGDYFLAGRRAAVAQLWNRALARGEVRDDVDLDTVIDLLFGPLLFRLMSGNTALTPERADALTDAVLNGLLR